MLINGDNGVIKSTDNIIYLAKVSYYRYISLRQLSLVMLQSVILFII